MALALLLTLMGLAARSSPQPLVDHKESTAIPAVVVLPLPEVKRPNQALVESSSRREAATKAPEPTVKVKHARNAKPKKRVQDCDPPFFIDTNGIRRIKAGCL